MSIVTRLGILASWQEVKELVTCDQLVVDLQPASKTMPSLAPLREKLEAAGLGETAVQECLQVVENDICGQLVSELKEERQKKNRLLLQLASLEVVGAGEGRMMISYVLKQACVGEGRKSGPGGGGETLAGFGFWLCSIIKAPSVYFSWLL